MHRTLMMGVWFLTIIAFIIIIVKEKTIEKGYHQGIGIIVLILTFMQPIIAQMRCGPGHPNRLWFNWIHWIVGSAAHLLARTFIALPSMSIYRVHY
jgi:hypothetical protein